MVHCLELQAAVDEVEPLRAFNVHGRAQLALSEGLRGSEVRSAGAPVRESDLHVEGHCYKMAGQQEYGARLPSRDAAVEEDVEKDDGVDGDSGDFGRPRPPSAAFRMRARGDKVCPGQKVEVEACDGHDGIIGILLVYDGEGSEGVPWEVGAVVARFDGFEETWRGGEERNILNVRVVFLQSEY